MPQLYELSDFNENVPFKCTVHHIGHIRPHMHDFFEIIFILSGSCSMLILDQLYQLAESDIITVDSRVIHELRASDCVYVSVQMDQTTLENTFPVPIHPEFRCSSQIPGHEKQFDQMRKLIAQMVKNNADQQSGYEIRNWIYVYQLMDILYTHFRVEKSMVLYQKNHRYAARMAEITQIIKEHYREDLPLSRVAEMVHLSSPYFSKFFQEQFGMNYLTYLTQFRMNNAIHELINTNKNIEEISADNGFPNSHAFTQAFKKEYGMRPSVYRRSQKSQPTRELFPAPKQHDYMAGLKKYLSFTPAEQPAIPSMFGHGICSAANGKKKLRHTWRNVISVGKASDLLLYDIQMLLRRVQKEIGYSHIFFNGILSDDLHLYNRDADGKPVYNFVYVDKIFDFLLEIGLKPFLQFTYMPAALAKKPDHLLFGHLVSEPQDLPGWRGLIRSFMEHIISRYHMSEILQWKFSVWHQPDTPARLYGFEKLNDFYDFYQCTYDIVKGFHSRICFGSPSFFFLDDPKQLQWHTDFLEWCKSNGCVPDFLNYIYYDTRLAGGGNKSQSTFGFTDSMVLNEHTDGVKNFIRSVRRLTEHEKLNGLPVYVCEWNNTPSQQDLLNDTCYKSCYITKTILENYDMLESLSYWSLTDFMSEAPLPSDMLFGGLGLFTVNNLPKASYYALLFLRQLGDTFLAKGDGWFATRTEQDIRIIAWHYRHYSRLYAMGERFEMTAENRYAMFEPSQIFDLKIELQNAADKTYSVREYQLNRNSGSLFDAWKDMGCIDPENKEELDFLKSKSVPALRKYRLSPKDDTLTLDLHMELLEVRLIILQ